MINSELELDLQKILCDRLHISLSEIEAYCHRWYITEFALFGSVLRDDFRPDSDVDVLVTFAPDYQRTLSDIVRAQQELEELLGRDVDLTQKNNLANPFSRAEILRTHRIIYPSEKATLISIQIADKTALDNVRNNAALFDIEHSIREVQDFIQGANYQQYLENLLLRHAVERKCGIIARAIRRLSPEFRMAHLEVNWDEVAELEDLLSYPYDRTNDAEIWRIITTEMPNLLEQIQVLIPQLPEN
jgi:predicted nucleotidyltransferase/uncharacterized protein with HEPN domain